MNKAASTVFASLLLFSAALPNAAHSQSLPPTNPYVYVLVDSTLYASLASALSTYEQDLENAGFSVEISQDFGGTAEDIREFLQNEAKTHEMAGALLVGDVPYASYITEIGGYNYTYPWDLYYMDLDGNWIDSDGDDVYDKHRSGDGDLGPEIWVGRLWASTMTGNETKLLINYFDKNHRFRTGELTLPRRALAYFDDDFVSSADNVNSSLRMIYGNETTKVTLVTELNTTRAADYKTRLNDTSGYEWLHLEAHGNFKAHTFKAYGIWSDVFSSEIRKIDPHALFYNIMACRTTDYSRDNYIGGSYIFAHTYGLLVIGFTKPHGTWNVADFYGSLAKGKCIGQAFKEWFEKHGEFNQGYYYGMTILGDPTLRTPRIYNQTRDTAVTSIMAGATEVHSGSDVTINVAVKNKGVFVETVNVTVYYDDNNFIGRQTVSLFPASDRTLIFLWDTTGVRLGNHTIKAETSFLPQESNTDDNIMVDGTIRIRITGDVNDDGKVNVLDVILVCVNPGPVPPSPPECDVNGDSTVNVLDVILIFINAG